MSFNSSFDVISLALTVSSILIGAATFLLGFYLSQREKGVPEGRLTPFKYLLISLIIPVFIIIASAIYVVVFDTADSTINNFLFMSMIVSLVPTVALSIVMAKKW